MATISEMTKAFKGEVGKKESPANSNNVIYNTDYYGKPVSGSAYPWCCAFIWDIFRLKGMSSAFCGGKKTAYCPDVENYAKANGIWKSSGQEGDLCLMDFGKGRASHIGYVVSKSGNTYTTVEGNTSTSSNDNGGAVMVRTRTTSVIRGFYRPTYSNVQPVQHKIQYKAHSQNVGWQNWVFDGATAGVTGQSNRMEAFQLGTCAGGTVEFVKVHIQDIGWKTYDRPGLNTVIGTVGQSKRIEDICIKLNGFKFRVHEQGIGWTSWTDCDGISTLGSVGQSLRIEAIQIAKK